MLTFRCFAGSLTTHTHTHTQVHTSSVPPETYANVCNADGVAFKAAVRFRGTILHSAIPVAIYSNRAEFAANTRYTFLLFPFSSFLFFPFFLFFFFDFSRLGHANYLHPARSLFRRTSTMNTRCGIRIRLVCAVPALSSIFKNHLVIRMHRRSTWKPRSQREYSGRENRAPRR